VLKRKSVKQTLINNMPSLKKI